jgi:hypothetical protein
MKMKTYDSISLVVMYVPAQCLVSYESQFSTSTMRRNMLNLKAFLTIPQCREEALGML